MIGVSSAQVFLDEERRLLGDPPVTNISALPSAAQSRIAAARANVQRIIDAFKKVDSSYSPIFSECASWLLQGSFAGLMSHASQTRKRRQLSSCENENEGASSSNMTRWVKPRYGPDFI